MWDSVALSLKPIISVSRRWDLRKGSSINNLESTSIKFLLIWNSTGRNAISSQVLVGRKLPALGCLSVPYPSAPPLHPNSSPCCTALRLTAEMNSTNSKNTTFRSIARSRMADTIFKDFFVHKMAFELGTCLARFSCYNLLIHWVENGRENDRARQIQLMIFSKRSFSSTNAS